MSSLQLSNENQIHSIDKLYSSLIAYIDDKFNKLNQSNELILTEIKAIKAKLNIISEKTLMTPIESKEPEGFMLNFINNDPPIYISKTSKTEEVKYKLTIQNKGEIPLPINTLLVCQSSNENIYFKPTRINTHNPIIQHKSKVITIKIKIKNLNTIPPGEYSLLSYIKIPNLGRIAENPNSISIHIQENNSNSSSYNEI